MLPSVTNFPNDSSLLSPTTSTYEQPGMQYTDVASASAFEKSLLSNPWAGMTANQRMFYDPMLRDVWRQRSIFAPYTKFQYNLGSINAPVAQVTQMYDLHPNFDPIGQRQLSINASHFDTRAVQITFARYGAKVAYSKYEDIVTYWRENAGSNPVDAIRPIVTGKLGQNIVDVNDMLARNAFLSAPLALYNGGASSFGTLQQNAFANPTILSAIHLGMANRDVPYTQDPGANYGMITCITSPSVIYDIRQNSSPKDWLVPQAYASPERLLNYEIGQLLNVRFVQSPRATLFNCGQVLVQSTVTSPINAGDGAPNGTGISGLPNTKTDSTYIVGQIGNSTPYIQLASGTSAGDMATYAVGDRVTIHSIRTSAYGANNGVDFRDGTLNNRRIVGVDATNKRLQFDAPIMLDFTTDLTGGGVYAYVTKGIHVHSMIFIGGDDGIVAGVGRPPRLYNPPPVDDWEQVYRFSWDSYMGYNNYNPLVIENVFTAATYREVGSINYAQS